MRAPRYEEATSPARATAPDEVGRASGPKVSRARVSHRVGGRTSRINSLVKRATCVRKGAKWSGVEWFSDRYTRTKTPNPKNGEKTNKQCATFHIAAAVFSGGLSSLFLFFLSNI